MPLRGCATSPRDWWTPPCDNYMFPGGCVTPPHSKDMTPWRKATPLRGRNTPLRISGTSQKMFVTPENGRAGRHTAYAVSVEGGTAAAPHSAAPPASTQHSQARTSNSSWW